LTIRPYTHKDKKELIALIQFHIPKYFATDEKQDFIDYLEKEKEDYFVIEEKEKIIGAGGINYFPEQAIARIAWDLVHPDFQGKGVGTKLTQFRIDLIKRNPQIKSIIVRTSQLVYLYYQKFGFQTKKIEKDFWAKGFDLYEMSMILDRD